MFKKKKCNVIILSGGFGTRLGKLTKKTPKPLLEFKRKPFIQYLIDYMCKFGFYKFYLATYYKSKKFNEFKKRYLNDNKYASLTIINEPKPLGTGGAVKNCMKKIYYENSIVLNADTLVMGNFNNYYNIMKKKNFAIIGNYLNKNLDRYGVISYHKNTVKNFLEKKKQKKNITKLINTGIFFFKKKSALKVFKNFKGKFSLEEKIYPELINDKKKFFVLKVTKPFIDIGVPKDLNNAEKFISLHLYNGK